MVIIPIILAYGLVVAAITAGLHRLRPNWSRRALIIASTAVSAFLVALIGVAWLAQQLSLSEEEVDLKWLGVAALFYGTPIAVVAAIPIALLSSWWAVSELRGGELESQPVEPVRGAEE